jgi:phosphohistidine phosphatase
MISIVFLLHPGVLPNVIEYPYTNTLFFFSSYSILPPPMTCAFNVAIRSSFLCSYHAENFQKAVSELRKDERMATLKAHVIGGGRIEYDEKKKSVFVYGYSMTFGRTPGCNKKTMEIIRKRFTEDEGDGPLAECEWSDEGY